MIAISQRVDIIESYKERRDGLDQRWYELLDQCGLSPIAIPNNTKVTEALLKEISFKGVILTGGGDLSSYGGKSPERDSVENILLNYAINNKLPLLGVCRGMQVIQNHFGVSLKRVTNHVNTRHTLSFQGKLETVNSYHAWGALSSVDVLPILAKADDGVIEAIEHLNFPIKGIMWHPEREDGFTSRDKQILKSLFKVAT